MQHDSSVSLYIFASAVCLMTVTPDCSFSRDEAIGSLVWSVSALFEALGLALGGRLVGRDKEPFTGLSFGVSTQASGAQV